MNGRSSVDRRILRAFYTQYISVLLILLVFCIGLVGSNKQVPGVGRAQLTNLSDRTAIGSLRLANAFSKDASSELLVAAELSAIRETLLNHDLRGVFTLYMHIGSDHEISAEIAAARVTALRSTLTAQGVPADAVEVLVEPTMLPSSDLQISFESMERRHAAL
ncbi:MAG: hypothetical protein ACK5GN_01060 [Pseudomonadota bacterium]|jgi:hypothetical protein